MYLTLLMYNALMLIKQLQYSIRTRLMQDISTYPMASWNQSNQIQEHKKEYKREEAIRPILLIWLLVAYQSQNLIKQLLERSQGVSVNNVTGELVPDSHNFLCKKVHKICSECALI